MQRAAGHIPPGRRHFRPLQEYVKASAAGQHLRLLTAHDLLVKPRSGRGGVSDAAVASGGYAGTSGGGGGHSGRGDFDTAWRDSGASRAGRRVGSAAAGGGGEGWEGSGAAVDATGSWGAAGSAAGHPGGAAPAWKDNSAAVAGWSAAAGGSGGAGAHNDDASAVAAGSQDLGALSDWTVYNAQSDAGGNHDNGGSASQGCGGWEGGQIAGAGWGATKSAPIANWGGMTQQHPAAPPHGAHPAGAAAQRGKRQPATAAAQVPGSDDFGSAFAPAAKSRGGGIGGVGQRELPGRAEKAPVEGGLRRRQVSRDPEGNSRQGGAMAGGAAWHAAAFLAAFYPPGNGY